MEPWFVDMKAMELLLTLILMWLTDFGSGLILTYTYKNQLFELVDVSRSGSGGASLLRCSSGGCVCCLRGVGTAWIACSPLGTYRGLLGFLCPSGWFFVTEVGFCLCSLFDNCLFFKFLRIWPI